MTSAQVQFLLHRYLTGHCTPEEAALVEAWCEEQQDAYPWEVRADQRETIRDRMLSKIRTELADDLSRRHIPWRQHSAVAAAVLILGIGAWLFVVKRNAGTLPRLAATAVDWSPGGDHAILTLAGGRRLILDSTANGVLTLQGNRVVKQDGLLDYRGGGAKQEYREKELNTLATPPGGQYHLILPDGTRVWLDAASSITYPTAFNEKVRHVSVTGQAYFEVAHNAHQPFEADVQGLAIQDIGTAFNINAYNDELSTRITLVSGAIALGEPERHVLLQKTGQQVQWTAGHAGAVKICDLASVLAWKNGLFYLTSADIPSVMRQLSRWYNVDILYEHGTPSGHITGEVPRNTSLSNVLKVLQASGVHCAVQGRTIHVML